MGVNYFAHYHTCNCCGKEKKVVHIGNSSHGWQFHFHTPSYDIRCAQDWRREMITPGVVVKDEEGNTVSYDDFWAMVKQKQEDPYHMSYYRICRGEAATEREREYLDRYPRILHESGYERGVYLDEEGFTFDPGEFS